MKYRKLGNTGLEVSILGFGGMRLPMKGARVDRDVAVPMLRRAQELGINLFDTAVGYCNRDSQRALGEALEPVRDKVVISTKNPYHFAEPDEWWRALEESLEFLRTDYIDIYNHHGLRWKTYEERLDPEKGGLTGQMISAKEQGLIRHIGFSFHDTPENLIKLAETGYYESVILQYNLLDQKNAEAMHRVKELGLGVIVMGPVGGGRLGIPSGKIVELTGGQVSSTPEAAFRFVWAHPAVSSALSGMASMEMIEDNVRIADQCQPFNREDIDRINALVQERLERSGLYCSGCAYCLEVCPAGVQIPFNLDQLNLSRIFGLRDGARKWYNGLVGRAIICVNCGRCVEKCPQGIDIPARLRETVMELDPNAGKVTVAARLAGINGEGEFELTAEALNVSDETREVSVAIAPGAGVDMPQCQFGAPAMQPFARLRHRLSGKVEPGADRIPLTARLSWNHTEETVELSVPFLTLKKGLSDGWADGTWREVIPTEDDFKAAPDAARLHSLRFKLSYDDNSLLLLADVRDDFLCPTRPELKGKPADSVVVFLDGRRKPAVGKPLHEEGVCSVTLYPGVPGDVPAFAHSRQEVAVDVVSERTEQGYRLRAFIPFEQFCVEPGVPEKIGFDLTVNTADAAGELVGRYAYTGGPRNARDASLFGEVWLL
jgi:predicted aldo/keto reductase-like oxidoreductase